MSTDTSSIDQFTYRPERIQPGTVYHYLKSNIDGSYPARIVIYVRDPKHLEVLKFEEHGMDAALVHAHMDWKTFSADRFESWWLTADGQHRPQATLSSSYEDCSFTISWQGRNDTVHIGHYPVHVYNFDLISLNLILPHWKYPEGKVTVGILQPNFDPNPDSMIKYEGTIQILYQGDEEHNDTLCRKYSIGGEGLKDQHGVMWVSKKNEMIEDVEIPIADNPDWHDFKLQFVDREHMDTQTWADFMNAEIQSLKS